MSLEVLALAAVGVAALVGITESAIRRSDVGAALVLAWIVTDETRVVDVTLQFGPVNVYPNDVLFAILAVAAAARFLRGGRLAPLQQVLLALGVLVLWSITRGAVEFGAMPSINEGRKFLVFVAAAAYFSTVEPRRELFDRLATVWLWGAAALAALAGIRWGGNAVGLHGTFFGAGGDLRVIPAAETLIVAQGAILAMTDRRPRTRFVRVGLAPTLFVVVVLLQHRTVWVVTAAAVCYLLIRERRLGRRAGTGLVAGLLVFATASFTILDDGNQPIGDQLTRSATTTNTFEWRVEGWRSLLASSGPSTAAERLTGAPFGGGWARMVEGRLVEVSPHNMFVETYMRIGALGLLGLLLLFAVASRRHGTPEATTVLDGAWGGRHVLAVLVGSQLIYYVTYSPDAAQAMLLGLAVATASGRPSGATGREHRRPTSIAVR